MTDESESDAERRNEIRKTMINEERKTLRQMQQFTRRSLQAETRLNSHSTVPTSTETWLRGVHVGLELGRLAIENLDRENMFEPEPDADGGGGGGE